MIFWAALALWAALSATSACPVYQLAAVDPNATVTNYTRLSDAVAASITIPALNVPIVVCDGLAVGADETFPVIDAAVTIVGETGGDGTAPFAYVAFAEGTGPVFTVAAGGSLLVRDAVLVANATSLFAVSGALALENVKCFYANPCITVSASAATATLDTVALIANPVGIVLEAGSVALRHSTFLDQLEAGIVSRVHAYDPYAGIAVYDVHFINALFPFAYQPSPGDPLAAPEFSADFVDRTMFFTSQTYSHAATTVDLFGTEGCPVCASSSSSDCTCELPNAKYINLFLVIGIWVGIFGCLLACLFRANTSGSAKRATASTWS